jgi:hypothetical protein
MSALRILGAWAIGLTAYTLGSAREKELARRREVEERVSRELQAVDEMLGRIQELQERMSGPASRQNLHWLQVDDSTGS